MMTINKRTILECAQAYNNNWNTNDELIEKRMKDILRTQRYLTRDNLREIGLWKSPRAKKHYNSRENDDLTVEEITRFAFATKSERARIGSLLTLRGVSWAVASAILHFAFADKYPIWDFRVLWSLGWYRRGKAPAYNFRLWQRYCSRVREISSRHGLSIRTVEKALWMYSKEHQPPSSSSA